MQQLDFIKYKRTDFNDLNKRHIKRLLLKMKDRKMHILKFMFWLPIVKILDKKRIFSVKNKQNGKYVKN